MPGRCNYNHWGRRDGVQHVEGVEKPIWFKEDESPCESNNGVGNVIYEEWHGWSAHVDIGDWNLNREVGKCENGTTRSQEQIQATILARLPKRRYEAVITSLNGKMGVMDLSTETLFQRSQDTTWCLLSCFKDNSKKRETKREAIEIRNIWR